MTKTLKKQLTALCVASLCGGALLWNGGALRAQGSGVRVRALGIDTPRVPLSRDEAARNFARLLQIINAQTPATQTMQETEATILSSFSAQSERELGESLTDVILKLAQQWQQPQFAVQVQNESADSATVVVSTEPQPVPRPFVLIREGESWGVDIFETYARWNGVSSAAARANLKGEFERASVEARRASCQSNLKQISLGMLQYAQDYDEKYPLAKPWVDVLQPYLKSEELFTCPALPTGQKYGYAFNSKLSNKLERQVASTSQTVSLYETSVLKRNAYGIGESPAFRHDGGANYAFADGHVKWFAKTEIPSFKLKP